MSAELVTLLKRGLSKVTRELNHVCIRVAYVPGRAGQGSALIVDYGSEQLKMEPTLRGFSRHRLVEDILQRPGEIDITADVDFGTLKYGQPGRK